MKTRNLEHLLDGHRLMMFYTRDLSIYNTPFNTDYNYNCVICKSASLYNCFQGDIEHYKEYCKKNDREWIFEDALCPLGFRPIAQKKSVVFSSSDKVLVTLQHKNGNKLQFVCKRILVYPSGPGDFECDIESIEFPDFLEVSLKVQLDDVYLNNYKQAYFSNNWVEDEEHITQLYKKKIAQSCYLPMPHEADILFKDNDNKFDIHIEYFEYSVYFDTINLIREYEAQKVFDSGKNFVRRDRNVLYFNSCVKTERHRSGTLSSEWNCDVYCYKIIRTNYSKSFDNSIISNLFFETINKKGNGKFGDVFWLNCDNYESTSEDCEDYEEMKDPYALNMTTESVDYLTSILTSGGWEMLVSYIDESAYARETVLTLIDYIVAKLKTSDEIECNAAKKDNICPINKGFDFSVDEAQTMLSYFLEEYSFRKNEGLLFEKCAEVVLSNESIWGKQVINRINCLKKMFT